MSDTENTTHEDALTGAETELFEALAYALREEPGNVGLIRVDFDGRSAAAVAHFAPTEEGDGGATVAPLALLLTLDLLPRVTPPSGFESTTDAGGEG